LAFDAIVPKSGNGGGQPEAPGLKVRAVINLRAGTALGLSPDRMRETVTAAFARHGHSIVADCVAPEAIAEEIRAAADGDVDVLVVGGGDGTVRAAARHLMGSRIALGILPLGTMNRLARDLAIPLDLAQAAEFLATAEPIQMDVAKVNERIFLCNSLMGATLRYSVGRARLRGRPAHERLPKYFRLIREILASRRKISIAVDNGDKLLRLRALSVAVTNNGYDESTPWLRRPELDRGKLTLYVSKHRSGWGLAKALLLATLGRWQDDPAIAKLTGTQFVIRSPQRRKRLSNDGEIEKLDTPLTYEIVPRALTVLARPKR
jgi:diacylglycerol kinase family enzyme